jgi:hypothetical protein
MLPRLTAKEIFGRWDYFRGLPRFAKITPRASAVERSWPANLRASLRSGPGAIMRASSKASAAAMSESSLSGEPCVSLLIARSNLLRLLKLVGKPAKLTWIPGNESVPRYHLGASIILVT